MAAPLPSGAQMSVFPEATRANLGMAAQDPNQILQNVATGIKLGGELARLGDLKAQIELERKQRKAEMAQTDYRLSAIDHATATLPKIVEQQRAQAEQATKEAQLATALATARAQANLPTLQAQTEEMQQTNALAGATADAVSGFPGMATPERAQTLAAAQARGSWGVSPGASTSADPTDDNPNFRATQMIDKIDPVTGNTVKIPVTINTKTGKVLNEGDALGITHLGENNKTTTQAAAEARGIDVTYSLLDNVKEQLTAYTSEGKGGLGQGAATIWANKKPEGLLSLLQSAIGRAAQSGDTQKLTAAIASLASGLTSAEFGKTVTKPEMEQLAPFIPQVTDIANPAVLANKLVEVEKRLSAKAAPLIEQKVFNRLGLKDPGSRFSPVSVAQAARDAKAPVAKGPGQPEAKPLNAGKQMFYRGKLYHVMSDGTGRQWLTPAT